MARTRATASNVTVSLGLVSFPVDVVPATRSKASEVSTKMVCPLCAPDKLSAVEQRYHCSHDSAHGPFTQGELSRALVVGGEMRPVTAEDLAEINGARSTGVELTVHPAVQVEAHTMPSGNIYRLRPKGAADHYGLMLELVRDTGVAFLAEFTNKGASRLYRLVARHDVLVLTELVRPSEFHEPEPVEARCDGRLLPTARMLVDSLLDEFDPESFVDRRRERLVALAAECAPVEELPVKRPAASVADELMEQLRRSVEAAAA